LFGSALASAGTVSISGAPPTTATVGTAYSFQPTAKDSSGLSITYRIYNRPSWASFDSATGRLSGTPGSSSVGTYRWVQIEASDGQSTAWLPAYTLTVSTASSSSTGGTTSGGTTSGGTSSGGITTGTKLSISGTPSTNASVGTAYSFQPATTVPSGTTATFNIYNKPSWATFDSATGRLYGTPTASNIGTYRWVQIAATDGGSTSWLPAYTLTVSSSSTSTGSTSSTGTVTISWMPPTQNTDGSTLTNLAGYHIYYGTSQSSLTKVVNITNPGLATYVLSNLSAATWYFAMTSVNSTGAESPRSAVVSYTVQ
jgi:hypothetical protein